MKRPELDGYVVAGSAPPMSCGVGDYTAHLVARLGVGSQVRTAQLVGTEPLSASHLFVERWSLSGVRSVVGDIRDSRPAVLSVQYPTAGYRRSLAIHALIPWVRLRRKRPRIVVTLHEQSASPRLGRLRNLTMTVPADAVVVSNGRDLEGLPRIIRRKSSVIPIGSNIGRVDLPVDERDALFNSLRLRADRPVVVFFGHAFHSKRLEFLIEAMGDLPGYQLLIVSRLDPTENSYHEMIVRRIEEQNALQPESVSVVTDADDHSVSKLLQLGTLFVMPDRNPLTAKSGSALAAATHGLVVLGQRGTDPRENAPFVDGFNSRLIEMGSASDLARTIEHVASNDALLSRLAVGARGLSEECDWARIVEGHLRIWG